MDDLDATRCRALWSSVLLLALSDAAGKPGTLDHGRADCWLRYGEAMLMVAALAGVDGTEVRRRYVAGSIRIPTTPRRAQSGMSGRKAA